MTLRLRITLSTIMIAVTATAGCTDRSAGSPMSEDTGTSAEPDTTPSTGSEPTGERPRDITLDGRDPCALIPQTDWPPLGIERPGRPSTHPAFMAPQCHYSGVGGVAVVVTEGIDAWEDQVEPSALRDADPIEGYPTITIRDQNGGFSCIAAVAVAKDQQLMTSVEHDLEDPGEPRRTRGMRSSQWN